MAGTTVADHVGGLLRAVGVQSDLTVWEAGKPCTSLWTADLLGLEYKDVTRLASHDKDGTQEQYLPASPDIIH
ncbi:g6940 [Coccomyxa elongata]